MISTQGSLASAILLQSGSQVFIQDSSLTKMVSHESYNFNKTGVIVAQNSEQIFIDQVIMSDNDNTNVFSDRTPVIVSNSDFV